LLEFALKNTKKPARVTVLNNNFRAIDLYKSLGFEVVEEKKGKIPLTNIEAIGLKMEQTS
jgi:ribosomal protein S18 acetylase RimI-like enzyme